MQRFIRNHLALTAICLVVCSAGWTSTAAAAKPWRLVLPDTVMISGSKALLRDVASAPVPASVGALVLHAGGEPNTVVTISQRYILRKLVIAGFSSGVSLLGAKECCLVFEGQELTTDVVVSQIRLILHELIPKRIPGAPDSWLEIQTPSLRMSAQADWRVELARKTPLKPGRNLVQVVLISSGQRKSFSVTVDLHSFDELPRISREIAKDTSLSAAQFSWEWRDLSDIPHGLVAGREAIIGASATNTLTAGSLLRVADLAKTPVILAGDSVELLVVRGQVAVTVRGIARQNGCLGQTIPIRNGLTGRLLNARVTGPGLVEWRRGHR